MTKVAVLCILLCLIGCDIVNKRNNKTIEGSVIRITKARLGKGYYKASYVYRFDFKGSKYEDSTTFWKGDSKLRRVIVGDNVNLKIVYNNEKVIESELLESNFYLEKPIKDCFIRGSYSGNYFYSIERYKRINPDAEYKLVELIKEKGSTFYGWNKVFIKRKDSKMGEEFPLISCHIIDGIYQIESKKDNIMYSFRIKPGKYISLEYNDIKCIYFFNEN